MDERKIIHGDCLEMLKTLPNESVDVCVTSPPYYGLRDYGTGTWVGGDPSCPHKRISKYSPSTMTGHNQEELVGNVGDAIYKNVCPLCGARRVDKQIGLEETPEDYIKKLTDVFHEVKRVLKKDGTLWVNIGDTYNSSSYHKDEKSSGYGKQGTNRGVYENVVERPKAENCKAKDLIGIPWMLAFSLRADGWYLRQDIIWHKPNPMPEPVKDRCTKSHEYIFLFSKSPQYYFDGEAISEPIMESSIKRYNQNIESQSGSYTPGKANGNMKAVMPKYGKYESAEQEASVRQGMNKERGNGIVAIRKKLPSQEEFVSFMRKRTTVDDLADSTEIKRTTIEHWFRTDTSGFSFPSVEDWLEIRDLVDDWSDEFADMNERMTNVTYESDEIGKNSNGRRNKRDVWTIIPSHVKEAHFATFPEGLVEPCILAGSRLGGVVLDPFLGSGTTGRVAERLGRKWIGIELNEEYIEIAKKRTDNVQTQLLF